MKTLKEIVGICKSGDKPSLDEARLAVCVLDALLTFETMHLMNKAKNNINAWRDYEKHFERCKNAFSKSPIDYLGVEYDPDNPAVQKQRNASIKLFNKII